MEAREFIEDFKSKIENSEQILLKSLSGSIDRLQKAFPRYESFLMEFLQNADDENSSKFFVTLKEDKLIIANDGNSFTEKNVRSLCAVGNSDKSLNNYIGYLGVGFKSVFLISDLVQVISPPYYFEFSKNYWNGEKFPWQVTPIWNEELKKLETEFNTTFIIHLKTKEFTSRIQAELSPKHINNRILLFLRNITSITFDDQIKSELRKFEKTILDQKEEYSIWKIQEGNVIERWLAVSNNVNVPEEIKLDQVTKDWERADVSVRSISAVFKLDPDYNLVAETNATAHIGVFSFIPLREVQSGLKFLVQADFITNLGRGDIDRESKWNTWIASEIKKIILEKCVSIFKQNHKWKLNFTSILYTSALSGHPLFIEYIVKPIRGFLETEKVFFSEDNSFVSKEEVVWMTGELIDLLEVQDFEVLYPGKKLLNRNSRPYFPDSKDKIYSNSLDPIAYEKFSEKLIELKLIEKNYSWFEKLFAYIINKYQKNYFKSHFTRYNVEYTNFWKRFTEQNYKLIPTADNFIVSANDCLLNSQKIDIPSLLKGIIHFPHPLIQVNNNFQRFVEIVRSHNRICFKEISEKRIRHILVEQDILEADEEKWNNKSSEEKNEFIKILFTVYKKIDLKKYKYLTLLSKEGNWVKPDEIFFGSAYNSEKQNFEKIISDGFLDIKLEFLSDEYLKIEDAPLHLIKIFFSALGVDEDTKNKKIIERIGVLKALRFESSENRNAKELGDSEKPGYDIISEDDDGGKRFIEVKSSSSNTCDIFLTSNEYLTLKKDPDNYYVYVVTDALKHPVLNIISGKELNTIDETKVTFPYNRWHQKKII